jgi:hypothetical protein
MDTRRREQIQRSLRSLAEAHRATMELMEETLALLCEELSLDPLTYLRTLPAPRDAPAAGPDLSIDPAVLSVRFQGKVCFLGNTLPFKFLRRLAQRPNPQLHDLLVTVFNEPEPAHADALRAAVTGLPGVGWLKHAAGLRQPRR